jgi:cell division transport system permease protein
MNSFRNLDFFLREAWIGLQRSSLMSLVCFITVTISLIVFGSFLIVILNLTNLINTISSRMEMVVYLNENLDRAKTDTLQNQIALFSNVAEVSFVPKDEAWRIFRQTMQNRLDIGGVVKDNPLPNSIKIKVKDLNLIGDTAKAIVAMQGVDEVRYGGKLAYRISTFTSAVRTAGIIFLIILGLATLLIVINTIRLTVIARQNEIIIMQLVGATDSFIKWPFIIEGIFIGFGASALAILILRLFYATIIVNLQETLPFFSLLFSKQQIGLIYLIVSLSGIFLGMFGGYVSVSRFLKMQNV